MLRSGSRWPIGHMVISVGRNVPDVAERNRVSDSPLQLVRLNTA
jgi:hypothetical protein